MNEKDRSFLLAIAKSVQAQCQFLFAKEMEGKGLFFDNVKLAQDKLADVTNQLSNWIKEYEDGSGL